MYVCIVKVICVYPESLVTDPEISNASILRVQIVSWYFRYLFGSSGMHILCDQVCVSSVFSACIVGVQFRCESILGVRSVYPGSPIVYTSST